MSNINADVNANLRIVGNVKPYTTDPLQGWIQLEEVRNLFRETVTGIRVEQKKLTAIISGPVDVLKVMVDDWKANGVPGRICVTECVHSDLPQSFVENTKNLDQYAKVAGDTKVPCTLDGEQIYRFSKYDPSGMMSDKLVQHDNHDAISEVSKALREARKLAVSEARVASGNNDDVAIVVETTEEAAVASL